MRTRRARQLREHLNGCDDVLDVGSGRRPSLDLTQHTKGARFTRWILARLGFCFPNLHDQQEMALQAQKAVRRFQREMGLRETGEVDRETLLLLHAMVVGGALSAELAPDYNRLYRGGVMHVTVALGHDDAGTTPETQSKILKSLVAMGFRIIEPGKLDDEARHRLGLDRFDMCVTHLVKHHTDKLTGEKIATVVKLFSPRSAGAPQLVDTFSKALQEDDVVIYAGHGRHGGGPDFDSIDSAAGRFIMDPSKDGRGQPREPIGPSDLTRLTSRPPYQLLYMSACESENYLTQLRDPQLFRGRTNENTHIIATTMQTALRGYGSKVAAFIDGLTERASLPELVNSMGTIECLLAESARAEAETSGVLGDPGLRDYFEDEIARSKHAELGNGFLASWWSRTRREC